MTMGIAALQERIGTPVDGRWGPGSKAALLAHGSARTFPVRRCRGRAGSCRYRANRNVGMATDIEAALSKGECGQ